MSGYYPPRARWYSRFYYPWRALWRRLPFDRVRLPGGFTLRQVLLAVIVPGFVYHVLRRPRIGWGIQLAYGGLLLLVVVWLGTDAAALAYGLMVALHAISLAGLLGAWIEPEGVGRRVFLALASALLLAVLVYLPLRNWVQATLVVPLRIGNRALMVLPDDQAAGLKAEAGVVRVFRFGGGGVARGLMLGQGYVVAEIRGGPGDRIRFDHGQYFVNGRAYPARPLMPPAGAWVVPENHWFIWPDSSIRVQGALPVMDPGQREALLREIALVPASRLVGRPVRWWFWRKLYVP
jgi:hypothetical protein